MPFCSERMNTKVDSLQYLLRISSTTSRNCRNISRGCRKKFCSCKLSSELEMLFFLLLLSISSVHAASSSLLLSQVRGQIVATETRLNSDGEANQLPQAHRSYEQNCPTKDVAPNGAETWECSIKKLTQIAKQNCHATDIALNGMGKLRVKYNIRMVTGIRSRIAIQKTLP